MSLETLETSLDLLVLDDENVIENLSVLIKNIGEQKYGNEIEFEIEEITKEQQDEQYSKMMGGGNSVEPTFPYNKFKSVLDRVFNVKEEEKRKTLLESLFQVREPEPTKPVEKKEESSIFDWFKGKPEQKSIFDWLQQKPQDDKNGFVNWFQGKKEEEKTGILDWFKGKSDEEKHGFLDWLKNKPQDTNTNKDRENYSEWLKYKAENVNNGIAGFFKKAPEGEKKSYLEWLKDKPKDENTFEKEKQDFQNWFTNVGNKTKELFQGNQKEPVREPEPKSHDIVEEKRGEPEPKSDDIVEEKRGEPEQKPDEESMPILEEEDGLLIKRVKLGITSKPGIEMAVEKLQ